MVTIAARLAGRVMGTGDPIGPVTPDAPAEVKAGVNKILGLVMYVSIGMAVAMFFAAGAWAWAGNQGHGQGVSPQLQSRVMGGIIALVVIAGASGIASFFLG